MVLLEHTVPILLLKKFLSVALIAHNFNTKYNLCQKFKGNKLLRLHLDTKSKAVRPFCLIRSLLKKFCDFITVYKWIRKTFLAGLVSSFRIICLLKRRREDEIPKVIL